MLKTDHPWIKEDGEAPDKPLDNAVLNRLKQFRAMNQFKKVALKVMNGILAQYSGKIVSGFLPTIFFFFANFFSCSM